MTSLSTNHRTASTPRIGFLGCGWISQSRMQAILDSNSAQICAVADPDVSALKRVKQLLPDVALESNLDDLLKYDLDGIVIATPSSMHANQAIKALNNDLAVFCEKPLGRSACEAEAVVQSARRANRNLGVDFSYRHTEAACKIRELIHTGVLGPIYTIDLVFHNGYGPDKAWYYDPAVSGGGCLIDLGIHLIDLLFWVLGDRTVNLVQGSLYGLGKRLFSREQVIEDHAFANLIIDPDINVRLNCSWRRAIGQDAYILAAFTGPFGSASLSNVGGSFYEFRAEHCVGTNKTILCEPPDFWSGRAICDWAVKLAASKYYDSSADEYLLSARTIDRIYADSTRNGETSRPGQSAIHAS